MRWYILKLVGIKNSKIRILINKYKSLSELIKKFEQENELSEDEKMKILQGIENDKSLKFFKNLSEQGIILLDLKNENYPESLKNISKPPLFLFCKGDITLLKKERMISIVGTRKASKYGEIGVKRVVENLIEGDVVIVSGLAVGIDNLAHKKTLELNGKTIAILACGIDIAYPKGTYLQRKKIEEKGLVISEFPLGTNPTPQKFPIRNRIIAGLSRGVVVIESPKRSGSLITATIALDEDRDVFVIPGEITSPLSEGSNNLIKNLKGKLITSGEDILEEYSWDKKQKQNEEKNSLTGDKLKVYNSLKVKMNLEELKNEVKFDIIKLLGVLMELELEGFIQSLPAGYYRRKN